MTRRFQPDLYLFDMLYAMETLVRRVVPRWFLHPRWSRVFEMPVPRRPGEGLPGVEFRWATTKDTPLLESHFGEKLVTARHSYGHRAAILVKEQKLVGAAYFASRGYYDFDTDTRITLGFDESWLYGAWIRPGYRGRGLYSYLLREAAGDLRRRGVTRLMFAIATLNIRAKRIHRSMRAEPIGRIYGVRLVNYNAYRFSRKPFT